jgi:hypothetical protein
MQRPRTAYISPEIESLLLSRYEDVRGMTHFEERENDVFAFGVFAFVVFLYPLMPLNSRNRRSEDMLYGHILEKNWPAFWNA